MRMKMPTVSANEAKARFGTIMEQAQREPVTITRHGRPSTVMVSATDYVHIRELFEAVEDQEWLQRARTAEQEGFVGVAESEAFLNSLLADHASA